MIIKFPPQRRDKDTSFRHLFDYLTEGLPENGADIDLISFHDLTQYITAQTVVDQMGDEIDKTLAVEIGNLTSLQTAVAEMYAVSHQNTRAHDPVLHYIISWPENEKPPVKDVLSAARYTIEALGLSEHQYVIAVHVNTDNLHAHIEVNKIHPITYKSHHIEWAQKTGHKAARELEIKYGWSHDNGLYIVEEVNGVKRIIEASKSDQENTTSSRANRFETWSGQESFETWCKQAPAPALKALLDKPEKIQSWNDVHTVMATYGVELKYTGGGYRVETIPTPAAEPKTDGSSDDANVDKPVAIAASKVFRFMKPKELEQKLGKFTPFDPALVTVKPERTYKRDPLKRLIRREERREAREELFKRYQAEKHHIENEAFMVKSLSKRESQDTWKKGFTELKKDYDARRLAMQRDKSLTGPQKQLLYMQLKLAHNQAVAELKDQCKQIREHYAAETPTKQSWRAWVEREAKNGNPAAISALRGMTYRERRNLRQELNADGTPIDDQVEENQILPVFNDRIDGFAAPEEKSEPDPTIQPIRELKWTVTSNGRVVYSFNRKDRHGDLGFIDEGRRVIFGRKDVSDRALRAALEYSMMKWGPTLNLTGGNKAFQERVIKMAVEMGMRVRNPEFHQMQMQAIAQAGPAAKKSTSRLSVDREIQKILQKQPTMRFDYAVHQGNSETYRGRIALVTESHVIQQTGPNQMILHDISRLGSIPKARKPATIIYHGGAARVEQDLTQGRRR